ncbi:hypothetical protein IT570_06355 [Candidatus Sumerlaeota bacterium]|nr:hypothetical protein [Candidatus Sumerlaeota bacterium]
MRSVILLSAFSLLMISGTATAQETMKPMDGMQSMAATAPEATQRMKSITCRTTSGEVTRFFQIDTNKEGIKRLQEVNPPGIETTKPIPTAAESPWLMSVLGFEKQAEGASTEKVLGPDKKAYTFKLPDNKTDAGKGPGGEVVLRVDNWTKPPNGAWERAGDTTAKQPPTAKEAESAWRAAPEPPKKGGQKSTAAAAPTGMDPMAMSASTASSHEKSKVSAAEKERQKKLELLKQKQRKERAQEEAMKRKKDLEKKRRNAKKN